MCDGTTASGRSGPANSRESTADEAARSAVGSSASHLLVLKRIAAELFPSEAVVEETRPASPNGR